MGRTGEQAASAVGPGISVCGYMDVKQRSDAVSGDGVRSRDGRGRAWRGIRATFVLVVISIVGFLVVWSECVAWAEVPLGWAVESVWSFGACPALARRGGLVAAAVWLDGDVWRIATSAFLHASWLHLGLNVWSLAVIVPWAEAAWGSGRALVLFGLSAGLAAVASLAWAEAPLVVGSSGGGFGVLAALWVARSWGRGSIAEVLAPLSPWGLGVTLGVLAGVGFFVPVVAQAGHLGGAAAGLVIGWAWSAEGSVRRGLGLGGLGMLFLGVGWVARHPGSRPNFHVFVGRELVERGAIDEGIAELLRATELAKGDPDVDNEAAYAMAVEGVELERAEVLARRASARRPEDADIADTLGWVLCRDGRTEAGLIELRRAVVLSSSQDDVIREHVETCGPAAVAGVPRGTSAERLPE